MKNKSVRLPKYIAPERYAITLRPDMDAFVFEGEETIHLTLSRPVKEITLHAKDLQVVSAEYSKIKNEIWAGKISYNDKAETVTLRFPKKLPLGKGKLQLTFRGVLNNELRGFYRSSYMHEGVEKFIATTQFEATDARRAFPCFDEPDKKAVFDVTLKVPVNHEVVSNTLPLGIEEHEGGIKTVRFAPTPKMSTYLLAFISGEFEYIEDKTKSGVLVRVFVTPGKKHQAKFALDVGVKILEFYEKYFDIKYPLPTLDMVAIPDFAAGAMENWGAVTYRETALLVDPEHSSATTKQWVAMVVAHELAHQWFGNLVTMEWWTHLWLNEGFASYIEYLAVDTLFPDWHMWTQFAVLDYAAGIQKDALKNTHPIEVDVHHPNEIGEIFDDISYRKGASVIRMLASFLGEKHFRDGLRYYLKKHAYKNATTEDLWAAFEKVSGEPVRSMMHVWTRRPGYPLITADHSNGYLLLSQKRFYSSPENLETSKDTTLWPVPISHTGSAKKFLMTTKRAAIEVPAGNGMPKLNLGETGFYRVAYTASAWENFAGAISAQTFSPLDRLGLANNVWTLTEAGLVSTATALRVSRSFKNETEYTVWLELLSSLGQVYRLWFVQPAIRRQLELFVQDLLASAIKKVGFVSRPSDSHMERLLRSLILQAAGTFGHAGVLAKSQALFRKAKKNVQQLPADFRGFVYVHAAESGGADEFEVLKNLYVRTDMSEEKNRIGRALAAFRNKTLLKKALAFSLSKAVRSQDALRFNAAVGANPLGGEVNWECMKANWKQYLEMYGQGGHLLSQLVDSLSRLSSFAAAKDVEKFFKTHPAPGAERTVQQVIEHIRTNALWIERDTEDIKTFLVPAHAKRKK